MAAKEKTSRLTAWLAPILFLLAAVIAAQPASALTARATETRAWEKTSAPLESRQLQSLQLLNLHQQNDVAGYDDALGSPLAAESEAGGIAVNNAGFPNPMVEVTRTTPSELIDSARAEFNSSRIDASSRGNFLRQFADTPDAQSFFSDSELARMQAGKVPEGWEVHHMQPLFRGGDNNFYNLILVPEQWHADNFFDLHFYPEGQNPFGRN